ncbi:prolyl 4-hydroxylase subunit alpha-1 [Hyalella azteca]|uniref:procollagen-proline 4-dioxygenase n=1 Tax=Hyalella azteca TaxID=294128 RepID=A0A979FTZ4_HYAAZ|nr:prolyl 4-hydroxylase subunit alpha-1 [Hyalella azteca]
MGKSLEAVVMLILLVNFNVQKHVMADVFTSMTDMHTLLDTESEIIRTMEDYITTQEAKLVKLRKDVAEMEALHRLASQSPDQFLGHPINAFLLVKRLTLDWAEWQTTLTSDPVGQAVLANFTSRGEGVLKWPDEEDLSGVATALMRLQDTYQLDTSRMAEGYINDMPPAHKQLSASDCFELGRQSYNSGDHYHTVLWMNEALGRLEEEKDTSSRSLPARTITKADILEYLAFSNYMQGHIKYALKLTDELIELRPDHQRALGNKAYYEEALKKAGDGRRGEDGRLLQDEAVQKGYTVQEETDDIESLGSSWQRERDAYERLCRGEVHSSPQAVASLTCHYQTGPAPFLRIAPVRAEVAHVHPTITLYHDVLSEREIETIKRLALPRFKRATVQNYKTGALETASYRISKSAWLKEEDDNTVARVNRRIASITGLEMSTAEELQVANYGVGGHYEPHFDYARADEIGPDGYVGPFGNRLATWLFYVRLIVPFKHHSSARDFAITNADEIGPDGYVGPFGNRLATWLFYLSNNHHVFPLRRSTCRPVTSPILFSVSNKWIHERGQEFLRPCELDRNAQ